MTIANNSTNLTVSVIFTCNFNILCERKKAFQTFQQQWYYISFLVLWNYESSIPHFLGSLSQGIFQQEAGHLGSVMYLMHGIWNSSPSGPNHVGCIYVLHSRETDVHIKDMLDIWSNLFPKCWKPGFLFKVNNKWILALKWFSLHSSKK